jgi:hypothetical protein
VVPALGTPTEEATHRTVNNGRRHLSALVSLYSVEFLFVTRAIVDQRLVEPPTPFDSRVSTNYVVFLILQQLKQFSGDWSLQSLVANRV